jgi:hypothetical protein
MQDFLISSKNCIRTFRCKEGIEIVRGSPVGLNEKIRLCPADETIDSIEFIGIANQGCGRGDLYRDIEVIFGESIIVITQDAVAKGEKLKKWSKVGCRRGLFVPNMLAPEYLPIGEVKKVLYGETKTMYEIEIYSCFEKYRPEGRIDKPMTEEMGPVVINYHHLKKMGLVEPDFEYESLDSWTGEEDD